MDGLDQLADRLWATAVVRWIRPIVEHGYRVHYTEQPGDRTPARAVIDAWFVKAAQALRDVGRAVVEALRLTFSETSRQSLDYRRDQLARVLRLDAFSQTTRDRINSLEGILLDQDLSPVNQGALFARRVRLETNLFALEAAQARSEGFKALASVADTGDQPALRDAARQASRPASSVRDAERELAKVDEKLYSGNQLDPTEVAELRDKLRITYGNGHKDHETWRNNVVRESRGLATAVLNAATLQRGLDEQAATGEEYIKRWFATLTDTRTRPTHLDANTQTVGLLEQFHVGEAQMDHPGDFNAPPEERVNCRCSMWVGSRATHDLIAQSLQAAGVMQEDDVTAVAEEVGAGSDTRLPIGWRGILAALEHRTGDGRYLRVPAAGVRFRQEPLPIAYQSTMAPGHDGGVVVSRIAKYWVDDTTSPPMLWGQGPFDLGKPEGMEAARELHVGNWNGISVDLDDITVTWDDDSETAYFDDWRVMGATMVAHPAFDEARIQPVYADDLDLTLVASLQAPADELLVSGPMPGEHIYPADWFADPKFTEYTPLTITSDGRVFGHIADRNICHIGIGDICVYAPRSATGYAYFHVGECLTDRGPLGIGKLTVGAGHADINLGYRPATAHYDNSASSVAYVRAYDDGIGVAVAGAIIDGTPHERVSEMRAHPPSGDWRPIGAGLEMVGALGVVIPGFPGPRTKAVIAGGQVRSLQAAGWVAPRSIEETVNAEVVKTVRRMERANELRARIAPTEAQRRARMADLAVRFTPNNEEDR